MSNLFKASKTEMLAFSFLSGKSRPNCPLMVPDRIQLTLVLNRPLIQLAFFKVLTSRLNQAEETSSHVERILREERRKTARLEHQLERAHVTIRDSDSGKSSISAHSQRTTASLGVGEGASDLQVG